MLAVVQHLVDFARRQLGAVTQLLFQQGHHVAQTQVDLVHGVVEVLRQQFSDVFQRLANLGFFLLPHRMQRVHQQTYDRQVQHQNAHDQN